MQDTTHEEHDTRLRTDQEQLEESTPTDSSTQPPRARGRFESDIPVERTWLERYGSRAMVVVMLAAVSIVAYLSITPNDTPFEQDASELITIEEGEMLGVDDSVNQRLDLPGGQTLDTTPNTNGDYAVSTPPSLTASPLTGSDLGPDEMNAGIGNAANTAATSSQPASTTGTNGNMDQLAGGPVLQLNAAAGIPNDLGSTQGDYPVTATPNYPRLHPGPSSVGGTDAAFASGPNALPGNAGATMQPSPTSPSGTNNGGTTNGSPGITGDATVMTTTNFPAPVVDWLRFHPENNRAAAVEGRHATGPAQDIRR
ncbi:MAG: hypothetical protein AAFP69_13800 [Planctomycetota bacterium]